VTESTLTFTSPCAVGPRLLFAAGGKVSFTHSPFAPPSLSPQIDILTMPTTLSPSALTNRRLQKELLHAYALSLGSDDGLSMEALAQVGEGVVRKTGKCKRLSTYITPLFSPSRHPPPKPRSLLHLADALSRVTHCHTAPFPGWLRKKELEERRAEHMVRLPNSSSFLAPLTVPLISPCPYIPTSALSFLHPPFSWSLSLLLFFLV
jgi:hypothetical protein